MAPLAQTAEFVENFRAAEPQTKNIWPSGDLAQFL
jgi:hypothetical protein